MSAEEMSAPGAKAEKRFTVNEGLDRDKMHAFREGLERVREEFPEIRGGTGFGSLTHGAGQPESDIDGFVFIEYERATKTVSTKALHNNAILMQSVGRVPPGFNSRLELMRIIYEDETDEEVRCRHYIEDTNAKEFYQKKINAAIQDVWQARGHTDVLDVSVVIIPMSESGIDAVIDERLKPNGRREDEWEFPERRSARGKVRPRFVCGMLAHIVGTLFHLECGGDVREYRAHLLTKLQHSGVEGEKIWEEIADNLKKWESGGGAREVRVPEALADAIKVYGRK